jgi:hypothetical protein
MTIEIDYRLSPPWSEGDATLDLAVADETSLRYYAFPGDQILRVDGVDFSAEWGWIPLLDFAASLVDAAAQLALGTAEAAIDFTENGARIVLRAHGADVTVSCTYSDGIARIGRAELAAAAEDYAARLLAELSARFPQLRANPDLARWYPRKA